MTVKKYLFVSPHLDDAVLSSTNFIAKLQSSGHDVKIITIFTKADNKSFSPKAIEHLKKGGYTNAVKLFNDRKKEDIEVAKILNVKYEHWNFIDAAFRKDAKGDFIYKGNDQFSGIVSDKDSSLEKRIESQLRASLKHKNTVIVAPLGIGGHVDHVIVRKIVENIKNTKFFWEDYPYNLDRQSTNYFLSTRKDYKLSFELNSTDDLIKEKTIRIYKSQTKMLFPDNDIRKLNEKYYSNQGVIKKSVVAIIPSLCSKKSYPVLKTCVDSLTTSANSNDIAIKIIIVTNGEHLSLKGIRKNVDLIIKVENPYSFSKMNNIAIDRGITKFNPEWFLLINDDAHVKKTFFKYFQSSTLVSKSDLVVPLVYNRKGPEIDSFGIEYFCSGHAKNSQILRRKTQLAAATCLLVNTNFLKLVKFKYGFYFNNLLVSYLEDVDFSIRSLAIGAKIVKLKDMIAYHEVSYSNGIKSNYVLYQSFRNLIWLILTTWPSKIIIKNIFNIMLVQFIMLVLCIRRLNPWLYIKIWPITIKNMPKILKLRRKIITNYLNNFDFETILSPYNFRTSRNIKIKFLKII